MKELTKRQEEIVQFIRRFLQERKYPPTFRDISEFFEITARGAYDHLKALEAKGAVRWDKNRARSIELMHEEMPAPAPEPVAVLPEAPAPAPVQTAPEMLTPVFDVYQVPLLGTVVAGQPLSSEENFDGYIPVARSLLGNGNYFALTVKGDSMVDAGIHAGDVAIIRAQETAENGDIIVAMVDDGITLKRFYREANRVRLKAENQAYPPIYTRDLRILGKLHHLYRSY